VGQNPGASSEPSTIMVTHNESVTCVTVTNKASRLCRGRTVRRTTGTTLSEHFAILLHSHHRER
jgi:hypothetical protein